ncbi:sarcosine oxidase subunit gamma [Hydrogenophaga sp. RWCD_12]|uniref:sarcosine oxidase subunit gamma n=1 Tax=Hydrogenophaga sp. RWCD_12 TaxID=3391190 RepID=UPI003984DB9A
MPETLTRKAHQMPPPAVVATGQPLLARQTIVGLLNLRGNPEDAAFLAAVEQALGMQPPLVACTTITVGDLRIIWTGPDEWLVVAPHGQEAALAARLRTALAGQHCAVTDVSSGFFQVGLCGPRVRDTLAQGCPMDLHPRAFPAHRAVGTHFYKVGLTLWLTAEHDRFQMLVRRSFIDHFWQLIDHASLESGRTDF